MKIENILVTSLLFVSVQTIAFQLLLDPWAAERFERLFRENARLFNPLLSLVSRIDNFREFVALSALVSSFLFFLG